MLELLMFKVAEVMELADVVDSKSTAGDSVPVRVRPSAPSSFALQKGFFIAPNPKPKVFQIALSVLPESADIPGSSARQSPKTLRSAHAPSYAPAHG